MNEPTTTFSDFGSSFGSPEPTRPTRRPLVWHGGADLGLLLLRLAIGGVFVAHGMQKVLGMWGYPGLVEFTRSVSEAGYQQPATMAMVTGVAEIVAGALVVLGLLMPLAAAALLAIKINTVALKAGAGTFFLSVNPVTAIEFDVVLGLGAAALVLAGPGRVALDNGRPWHRRPLSWGVLALLIGVTAGVLVFVFLRR